MSGQVDVLRAISKLCDDAIMLAGSGPQREVLLTTRDRLHGPLRVAIAGRVKAGKSTLLNALVGERLAPTDAGECTRIVSWYQQGFTYDVQALLKSGQHKPLRFSREEGSLNIDLGFHAADDVERLEVSWPSSNLSRMTLIDTPGLASLDDSTSARTRDFLALGEDDRQSDADAVIYLMRHLHRHDSEFLDAFLDRSVSNVSPVNAVGILSRADEIGAGRLDALESARAIADRYTGDERVQALCVNVLPVAGLLAETGMTLEESEAAALREIAGLDAQELSLMLLSVDRFCAPEASHVLEETRRDLLDRFGLFGVRYSIQAMRAGKVQSAPDLARMLVDISGLNALREVLDGHFAARAQMLKARSALSALRSAVRDLAAVDPPGAQRLLLETERFEASTHAFAELRLVHMVLSGMLKMSPEAKAEISRLTGGGSAASRVGCPAGASEDDIRMAALTGIERWRQMASSPLIDRDSSDAYNIAVRSYEGIYVNPV
jgi:hypothetical protein